MTAPIDATALADAYWRPFSDQETTAATSLIPRAWAKLKSQSTDLEKRIQADADLKLISEQVLIQACLRVIDNPRGARQISGGTDDYTESITIDQAHSAGGLYFTAEEIASLEPAAAQVSRRQNKAFTIDTTPTRAAL